VTTEQRDLTPSRTEVRDEHHTWWMELDGDGLTAVDSGGALAHVDVREDDDRVHLVFWLDDRLPGTVGTELTRRLFEHPALRHQRPVAASLPHRGVDVLTELRRHLAGATTHVAGATCLVVGRVR